MDPGEQPATGKSATPAIVKLTSRELADVAGRHVTDLVDHERRIAAERAVTSFPRARRLGRAILLGWLSIAETVACAWRWLWNPRHFLGRVSTRIRLLSPWTTFGWWTMLLLGFAGLMTYLRFAQLETKIHTFLWIFNVTENQEPWKTITGTLAAGALVALLVLLWNDLFRLPFLAWSIRRRVIRRPESVLLPDLLARQGRPLIEHLALDIVPRTELYDDLLPGVLARDRKDVQIIVGDAGAGKTTALLAVAQLLAQNGIVSVLVPLRNHERSEIIEQAKAHFTKQVQARVRSDGEAQLLWRWLMLRRRVAVLVDDIDQVAADGERGFVLRGMLDDAATSGLPVIVTARPAGVPAGIAASAIDLGALDERDAIDHVVRKAQDDPSFSPGSRPSRRRIGEWVKEGKLAEVPFYLELLARLAAVGQCPRLPQAGSVAGSPRDDGRVDRSADGEWRWNPLWVRFRLLEHFYEQTILGRVRRSLGIEPRERRSALRALEDAALGTLVATSLAARMKLEQRECTYGADGAQPLRQTIQEFIDTDDRVGLHHRGSSERLRVSAHEVIDAGERLSILDIKVEGTTAFHHRIMQAYLAGRCLARREHAADGEKRPNPVDRVPEIERDWTAALLDHRHPDKLTAHMTLTFAAMRAHEIAKASTGKKDRKNWDDVGRRIVRALIEGAKNAREGTPPDDDEPVKERSRMVVTLATETENQEAQLTVALSPKRADNATDVLNGTAAKLEPLYRPDPERRSDPDDALMKLTTAAEIARAVPGALETNASHKKAPSIAGEVRVTPGATRWTKLRAIEALAALEDKERWERIWEFARDPDYDVTRAASDALEENAYEAFKALAPQVEDLIARAAARSAYGHWLMRPEGSDQAEPDGAGGGISPMSAVITGRRTDGRVHDITNWRIDEDIRALKALGAVLPAIMSGFREDPSIELESNWPAKDEAGRTNGAHRSTASTSADAVDDDATDDVTCHPPNVHGDRLDYARRAHRALESLVALAFEGGQGDLEAAVAQGFRSDALRHALYPDRRVTGPGWVTCNRELVAGICLDNADFWYARMTLYQALALYAIAGANAQETLDVFARHLHRGGRDRHPFTQRVARLARAAVRRHELRSDRWQAFLWSDEGKATGRRAPRLSNAAAQLMADVTVLLNLNESSPEDRQDAFVEMQELPYCLSGSHDRAEILGGGCPSTCGWGLCPYRQPPPDEPDAHRGVRRAFCRQQREIALRRKPPWQRGIHRRKLREFWREMELRART
jgi:NACHT domain